MPIPKAIDHIVYAVSDLESGIAELQQKLGVKAQIGGRHSTQGTKNALINLDKDCYLELLCIDEENSQIQPPRWMGIDLYTKSQITRWALKSSQIEQGAAILKSYHPDMGKLFGGSRNVADGSVLKWNMCLPLAAPEVEIAPFLVDWSQSEIHPSKRMPDMNCKMLDFYAIHPNPESYANVMEKFGIDLRIERGENISLRLVLECPNGKVEI